jgi:SAM-dependent methyltransferase
MFPALELMNRPLYSRLVPYYEVVEGRDWRREIGLIASILKDHRSRSVVDLGCGTGYHVRALAKRGFEATGIDISNQNVRYARKRAKAERISAGFVVGSYYEYRALRRFDAALCLNWSIPVRDGEVKRFLDNTYSLLGPEGLLIFDFERTSQIVWSDVGKAITESWDQEREMVVRVSLGRMVSNVLTSRDVYLIYPKFSRVISPNERSRYEAPRGKDLVRTYVDVSFVRFFSMPEIRKFARRSGFRVVADFVLPRNRYKRTYAVLKKVPQNTTKTVS